MANLSISSFLLWGGDDLWTRRPWRRKAPTFLCKKNPAKHPHSGLFKKINSGLCCCERQSFQIHPVGCPAGPRISSSCGQQNLRSSGFIVITYHARDITLLITAVFKHRRSSGAQTLLIFLGGRFWTKADEFYWTHSQGAAPKFLPFSRNIQSLSPPPALSYHSGGGKKIQTKPAKHILHLPNAFLALCNKDNYAHIKLHGRNFIEFHSVSAKTTTSQPLAGEQWRREMCR